MNSHVSVRGNDVRGEHDGMIQLNCAEGVLDFIIADLPAISSEVDTVEVQFLVDDGQPFTVTMDAERSVGGDRNPCTGWDWSGPNAARLRNSSKLHACL